MKIFVNPALSSNFKKEKRNRQFYVLPEIKITQTLIFHFLDTKLSLFMSGREPPALHCYLLLMSWTSFVEQKNNLIFLVSVAGELSISNLTSHFWNQREIMFISLTDSTTRYGSHITLLPLKDKVFMYVLFVISSVLQLSICRKSI